MSALFLSTVEAVPFVFAVSEVRFVLSDQSDVSSLAAFFPKVPDSSTHAFPK